MPFWKRWFGREAAAGDGVDDAAGGGGEGDGAPGADRAFERRKLMADVRSKVAAELRANHLPEAPPALWRAMAELPRERFLPAVERAGAYLDEPLPIGHGQTISQPSLVALMTAALALKPTDRVLEIGVGSGYQTALLARLCGRVYGLELVPELAQRAARTLKALGIGNAEVRTADGAAGWPDAAPFDAVLAACAARELPPAVLDQLKVGGRLIAPVGPRLGPQMLVLLEKKAGGRVVETPLIPVRFVPMVGS